QLHLRVLQKRIWHLDGAMDNPEVHQNDYYQHNWPEACRDNIEDRDDQPLSQAVLPLKSAVIYRRPDQDNSCDYTSGQIDFEAHAEDPASEPQWGYGQCFLFVQPFHLI